MSDSYNSIKADLYDDLDQLSFRLRGAGFIVPSAGAWSLRTQFIDSHMLLFTDSGAGGLTVDGRFVELRAGSVYVACPGQLIEGSGRSPDGRSLFDLRFDVLEATPPADEPLHVAKRNPMFPGGGELLAPSPVSIGMLCEAVCRMWDSPSPLERFGARIRFQELLFTLLQDQVQAGANDDDAALELARNYAEQHYRDKIALGDLARIARMSQRHFMRRFKQKYGCSALDYITLQRIKEAQMLIRADHGHRVHDIARHVGYSDEFYFRRKFKQVTGVPPAKFRRNSMQKIAACQERCVGILLALQIVPCAAPDDHPWTAYYRRKYGRSDVLPLSGDETRAYEQLKLQKPDFIVTVESAWDLNKLSDVAPVCVVPWAGNDWRSHLRHVAKVLDRSEVAEAWLAGYAGKAQHVRSRISAVADHDRLLILRLHGERLQLPERHSVATVFYDDLRFAGPEEPVQTGIDGAISAERLTRLGADRILVILEEDNASQSAWQSLARSEPWLDLPAVRNGKVDTLPANPLYEYTAFTHELVLDEALKLWRDRA